MKVIPLKNRKAFNNILYIGDEAKDCMAIIEKFNSCLSEIEKRYAGWFNHRKRQFLKHDKLQRYIQYHFEGGIAIFKFKNENELPYAIRKECFKVCRSLAAGDQFYAF